MPSSVAVRRRADGGSNPTANHVLGAGRCDGSHRDRTEAIVRVFVAGASGVLGIRLLPLLVELGHEVAGMTRTSARAHAIEATGARPVACDVFDADRLAVVVGRFRPDLVVHQLTDLPDEADQVPAYAARNNRIRTEGTRNLLLAAHTAGTPRFLAQSIAWSPPGSGKAVAEHESMVLAAGGVVVRYGQLYGPGTFYPTQAPSPPRIHVDDAARRTLPLLEAPTGIVVLAEEGGA